jgi:hypothetical protein
MKVLDFVTPAKAGVHFQEEMDSRLRGNDVTFDGREPKDHGVCARNDSGV